MMRFNYSSLCCLARPLGTPISLELFENKKGKSQPAPKINRQPSVKKASPITVPSPGNVFSPPPPFQSFSLPNTTLLSNEFQRWLVQTPTLPLKIWRDEKSRKKVLSILREDRLKCDDSAWFRIPSNEYHLSSSTCQLSISAKMPSCTGPAFNRAVKWRWYGICLSKPSMSCFLCLRGRRLCDLTRKVCS